VFRRCAPGLRDATARPRQMSCPDAPALR
jgi:hypothetical protein